MSNLQQRIFDWARRVFIPEAMVESERNFRFLEEALELVQATGCTKEQALELVEYVFDRDAGDPYQEVGGVMLTLACLCSVIDVDMEQAGEDELARCDTPEVTAKILAKQKTKPVGYARPGYSK